jgi:pimeloyl-ACP methyl ester carboxylesterase
MDEKLQMQSSTRHAGRIQAKRLLLGLCVIYALFNITGFFSFYVGGAVAIATGIAFGFQSIGGHLVASRVSDCPLAQSHPLVYAGESVKWKSCGEINSHPLECSSISVPMDQFDQVHSGNKTFEIPLIRLRGRDAGPGQNILLNPGGPGGSGINFLYRKGEQLNTIIGEGYHLVSFDPRGINGSRPQALCYPDNDTRRKLSSVRKDDVIRDSPSVYAWTDNFVQACVDTTGEHGKYINTPQTAADMNSILDALGQDQLTYWGFSYGTLLGQTYATLFPDRVGRVIIDGVANVFDWYESLLDEEMWTDTDSVLDGFFDECIKAGKDCTLTTLADTKEELEDIIVNFGRELKEQPINVYINETHHGLIDFNSIFLNAFFGALYKPEGWHKLANTLTELLNGNGTQALLDYGLDSGPSAESTEAYNFVLLNDGQTGPKHWPQHRAPLLRRILKVFNASTFAITENDTFYQKAKWLLPNTHHFSPKRGVKTAHPLLILSTTYDPVCPLVSAQSARDAFEDSRIVEVLGYGHCSIAVPSTCLAQHVRQFLYHGEVPQNDTQCEVDTPYFLPPKDKSAHAASIFNESEDMLAIYEAQLELARADGWPAQW